VCSVLDLHPVPRGAGPVRPVTSFRHHAFEPHFARGLEQLGTDLALFERRDEDAIGPPREEPGEIRLAHRERKASKIVTVERHYVEGVKLDVVIMLARVQRVATRWQSGFLTFQTSFTGRVVPGCDPVAVCYS
jgi:hypothetical protein